MPDMAKRWSAKSHEPDSPSSRGAFRSFARRCVAPASLQPLGWLRLWSPVCLLIALWVPPGAPAAAAVESGESVSDTLAGRLSSYTVRRGESLGSLSARFGVGVSVLMRDNGMRNWAALTPGTVLKIDNRHIVPRASDEQLVINIPQRMLFSYSAETLASAYPAALGKPDWPTPTGGFEVVSLQQNKPWLVPKSIQEEMRRQGKAVRTRVPPGPNNPLGKHWIGLNVGGIGIHGTTAPGSIYGFRSHGCVRLHPEDVAELFGRVSVGDAGRLVYRPVMLARLEDGRIFVEVHGDPYKKAGDPLAKLRGLAAAAEIGTLIDWDKVAMAVKEQAGVAREVGLQPTREQARLVRLQSAH